MIVTAVPTGSGAAVQPFVAALPEVLAQCAAWPRKKLWPLLKTKFEVHWLPAVSVRTPGCTGAVVAGAQALAVAGASAQSSAEASKAPAIPARVNECRTPKSLSTLLKTG